MSVSFDDIYKANMNITRYRESLNKPDNIYYFIMFGYLEFAVSTFEEFSYEDLSYNKFEQEIYTFSETVATDTFSLNTSPPDNCIFYVQADDVVLDDSEYTYNDIVEEIVLSEPALDVYIGAYFIGEFINDIPRKEQLIIADAMTEWFVEGYVNDDLALEQVMYAGVEMRSQSQHNKTNLAVEQYRHTKSYQRMMRYAYGKSSAKSETLNLAKRGRGDYNG